MIKELSNCLIIYLILSYLVICDDNELDKSGTKGMLMNHFMKHWRSAKTLSHGEASLQ